VVAVLFLNIHLEAFKANFAKSVAFVI